MELPQSFMDESVRAMYAAARDKQAQRAAIMQQRLAQQQAGLDEQRMVRQTQIDQAINELSDDEKKFPAVMHDLARERALIDLDYKRRSSALRVFGLPAAEAERTMKVEEEALQPLKEMAKPFEETEQWKLQKENWGKLNESNKRVNSLVSTIDKAKELWNSGDKSAALEHMKMNVIKPLNSINSDDAVGNAEVLLKFRGLMSAPETAQFSNKSAFNPTVYFTQFLNARNKEEKEGARQGLLKTIEGLFQADPEGFLKTAIDGANSHIDSYNRQLQEKVINTTSPGVARTMGAVLMQPVSQIQAAPSNITVIRPGQEAQQSMQPQISREAAMAELERRKAARQSQQKDFTGKQGF